MQCPLPECQTTAGCAYRGPRGEFCYYSGRLKEIPPGGPAMNHREIVKRAKQYHERYLLSVARNAATKGRGDLHKVCELAEQAFAQALAEAHAAGRNEGLEDAAKVAESAFADNGLPDASEEEHKVIAGIIRALKEGQHDAG